MTHWLLGSMASPRWDLAIITAVVGVVGMCVIWLYASALDGFSFGPDTASSLDVDVRTTRIVLLAVTLLAVTALLTAVAVAAVGAIGFVDLIVPHGVRFLSGPLQLPHTVPR
ncbi:iron chelate uptake ABC transporter family permease subunit [Nonomuraea sp. H19]|uniref:iron chelate uptake ABC transporter family permease subunit n=1 Tax=Nonomuraea sp. H19 TaxID=3452206 RepID=UPI003F8AD698